jgi:hypothetical protein
MSASLGTVLGHVPVSTSAKGTADENVLAVQLCVPRTGRSTPRNCDAAGREFQPPDPA